MNQDISEKIDQLCSFVCNGKTYQYEQKLYKATKNELYDAAIIYAWNIFMLFVYEKVWQIREIEKLDEATKFQTDKHFLVLAKNKPDDYFDGNLFSLNKLSENKQGEDAVIGRLKEVYFGVDQQIFRETQQVLQKRNTAAHINSIDIEAEDLQYTLRELIKIIKAIQDDHKRHLQAIFDNLEKNKRWYLSNEDMRHIDDMFSSNDIDRLQYMHIAKLVSQQEFAQDTVNNIKQNAINYFLQSNNWNTAYENASLLIKPLINHLDKDDIKKILVEVFDKRGHEYNQILQAGKIEDIFWELYQLSSNNFPILEKEWKAFTKKLREENYDEAFEKLIPEIEAEQGEIEEN